jgi:hypothetical protein
MRRSAGILLVVSVVSAQLAVLASIHLAPARADRATGASSLGSADRSLRPGLRVRAEGLGLIVPEPGRGVWAAALQSDGRIRVLGVQTLSDGTVVIKRGPTVVSSGDSPAGACDDNAYTLYGESWKKNYAWYFNRKSIPGEVDGNNTAEALQDAVANMTRAENNCGLADRVSATYWYKGTTSDAVNIDTDSSCEGSDGKSVIGFGNLLATDLALTCWWTKNGNITAADIRFNKTEFLWVVNLGDACVTKFAVEAVATHEVGHVFGLGHVSEAAHGALTMSTTIKVCQESEKTLGLGDIRGLEALY